MIDFPKHDVGLTLTHNEHKTYYRTVAEELGDRECPPDFETPEDRQRCVDTNDMWVLRWYPSTPVGFVEVAGPDLDRLLAFARSGEATK